MLLNYRLGDVVALSTEPCDCGRSLPTIEAIAGRSNDLLASPDGQSRHALLFIAPLQAVPGVVQAQLLQERVDAVTVQVVTRANADWPAIEANVSRVAGRLLDAGVDVRVRRVAEIPREPSGKTRAVVSQCRPGHA